MKKDTLTKLSKDVRASISRHSPEILLGMGIAGMVTATVLSVRATPKALYLIEERKEELETDKLQPVEVVMTAWKCYVPAIITTCVSVACLIGSNSVNAKRNAALTAAYKLSETAFADYREKTIETIGEKKEKIVRDKISEKQIAENPLSKTDVIVTGKGGTLFFDPWSSRYFYSDLEKIKKVENILNKRIISDPFDAGVTLNDFYEEIGLPSTYTGGELGWKLNNGLIDIYPSAQMAEEGSEYEGQPCIVINFSTPPSYDFI